MIPKCCDKSLLCIQFNVVLCPPPQSFTSVSHDLWLINRGRKKKKDKLTGSNTFSIFHCSKKQKTAATAFIGQQLKNISYFNTLRTAELQNMKQDMDSTKQVAESKVLVSVILGSEFWWLKVIIGQPYTGQYSGSTQESLLFKPISSIKYFCITSLSGTLSLAQSAGKGEKKNLRCSRCICLTVKFPNLILL